MKSISLYPLYELDSDVALPAKIGDGISIVANNIIFDKLEKYNASEEDLYYIIETPLCLQIDEEVNPPKEASIAFIISCRLLKPTKVFIRYRVDPSNQIWKIRDNYPYLPSKNITTMIRQNEFKKIANLYTGLNKFKTINIRAINAVYFLSMAFRSRNWLESLIFHVCALETLTSAANRETKITEKFKNRIHNFIGYDKNKLETIYNIRSELVHGRHNSNSEKENLRLNRIAEEVCRKVFAKIFLTPNHITAFQNDTSRMKLF
jgi:hypothetical protein